jgi:hypothetical protein
MLARPRIRQLTLGELLDESFRIYRRDLLTLIALAALVIVPYTVLNFLLTLPMQQELAQFQQGAAVGAVPPDEEVFTSLITTTLLSTGVTVLLIMLYTIVFQPIMEGALTRAVTRRYLDQPVSVGDSISAAVRRSPALIVAKLLPSLILVVVFGLIFGCFAIMIGGAAFFTASQGGTEFDSGPGVGFGIAAVLGFFLLMIAVFVLTVLVLIRFLFTSQAIIAEGLGPIDALRRSWNLIKGFFWRTLGFVIVIGIINWLIQFIPSAIFLALFRIAVNDVVQLQLLSSISTAITSVLIMPFTLIAYTLMYYDLRIRKEGFDLEQQARTLLPEPGNPNFGQPLGS